MPSCTLGDPSATKARVVPLYHGSPLISTRADSLPPPPHPHFTSPHLHISASSAPFCHNPHRFESSFNPAILPLALPLQSPPHMHPYLRAVPPSPSSTIYFNLT
ncbi:hypothetical protein E2C01_038573 [Portunus trituberculatus]|uniref:Uncharacterized protein n=1 Tax=Portunus trituberculatus TaxID=210409 RepID=A0A5B7FEH2_PORTR|nr:hypothetical protein [Portunus trituberculatus]